MNLREELQSIYEEHGNKLTPKIVLDMSRPKNSPLHSRFEWNDKRAGEKYREQQAQELIQSVKITYRKGDKTETIRYFVSVCREDGYSYQPAEDVALNEVLTEIVLRDMERGWRQLQSRYGHFKEFASLVRDSLKAA